MVGVVCLFAVRPSQGKLYMWITFERYELGGLKVFYMPLCNKLCEGDFSFLIQPPQQSKKINKFAHFGLIWMRFAMNGKNGKQSCNPGVEGDLLVLPPISPPK